ncbi:ly6/PLAUR domain-containing protein 6B [Rhinophrynus dorsalis]
MQISPLLVLCVFKLFILVKNRTHAKNVNFNHVRPPLDPTPFPNSFKCFTCEKAKDNFNCNRWAEDRWCPQNTRFCKTIHHFTNHGRTTSVTKKCATREDCHAIGCHHHRDLGHTECVSCCDGMICNVEVPTNSSNAVFHVMKSYRTSDACRTMTHMYVFAATILLLIIR